LLVDSFDHLVQFHRSHMKGTNSLCILSRPTKRNAVTATRAPLLQLELEGTQQ